LRFGVLFYREPIVKSSNTAGKNTDKHNGCQRKQLPINNSCIQDIGLFLHQTNFSQELSKHTHKLYHIAHETLENYLNILHFSVINFPVNSDLGEIIFQAETSTNSHIIDCLKYYLSKPELKSSEKLALISHYLSAKDSADNSWIVQSGNIESSTWLLLNVPSQEQNKAKLLSSIMCKQLTHMAYHGKYNELQHEHLLLKKELSHTKLLNKIHSLAISLVTLDGLNGQKLFSAVVNLLNKQYQHINIHLIRSKPSKSECIYSTNNSSLKFSSKTIAYLQKQGPMVIPMALLPLIREAHHTAVVADIYSAVSIPLDKAQLALESTYTEILLVESLNERDPFTKQDLTLFEYVALVFSGGMDKNKSLLFENKLNDIKMNIEKDDNSKQHNNQLEQHLIEKHLQEHQFFKSILHDPLTGLANRTLMIDRLEQALIRQKRHPDKFALMFIDLDNFKPINDDLGHHVGDEVLKHAAKSINLSIRANDLAARWGGDEFVIFIDSIKDKSEIELITSRISQVFSKPFIYKKSIINLSCSIGINIFKPGQYSDADSIVQDTDVTMYEAKQQIGISVCYFKEYLLAEHRNNNLARDNLSQAIKHQEIIPHYQPMIRLINHQLFGFEVMARWKHGKQALKNACDFIPLAEKSGLIAELDLHILSQAMKQLHIWCQSHKTQSNIRISVNLSGCHLGDPSSLLKMCNNINSYGLKPSQLVFEFSERDVVEHNGQAIKSMKMLHKEGVLIGLDGFGTGFSSLNALFDYPVDYIKVHQSYTHKMLNSSRDLALVKAIRDMSNDLGFQVIIEGIETEKQHDKLIEIGCEFGQGHFIAHPMQHESISKLLN